MSVEENKRLVRRYIEEAGRFSADFCRLVLHFCKWGVRAGEGVHGEHG